MAEKVRFVPVDLRVHRSQLIDLNVEHMNWALTEIRSHYKVNAGVPSAREYVASTIDKLCSEVSNRGIYYLLEVENAIVGMGLLRQINENIGEIKRMYIRPAYRGKGYGKALLRKLLEKAKEFRYQSVYLDSGPFMTVAHHLYRSFGFVERKEYPETEVPPAFWSKWVFMEKTLGNKTK